MVYFYIYMLLYRLLQPNVFFFAGYVLSFWQGNKISFCKLERWDTILFLLVFCFF